MRLATLWVIVIGALCPVWAGAAELMMVTPWSEGEIILTRAAGAFVRYEAVVELQAGENHCQFDFAQSGLAAEAVRLSVLEPRETVVHRGREIKADEPGAVIWRLYTPTAGPARLQLTCGLKELESNLQYQALLQPDSRQLQLQAVLSLTNGSLLDLPQARVTVSSGQQITTDLKAGQSGQQPLFTHPGVPYESCYLYDYSRFKDAVQTWLILPRSDDSPASTQALLPGKLKVMAPGGGGAVTLVREVDLPYVPPGEKVELNLGAAAEVTVTRTKLKSEQTNVRTDVYRKNALYDLVEEWQLEFQHHRPGPLTLTVHEHFAGDWELLKQSHPTSQVHVDRAEFILILPPGEKQTLTYTVKRSNVEP